MMFRIAAEDFELTPAIRAQVEKGIAKVEEVLPAASSIQVFLSKEAPKNFTALFRVHHHGKDVVSSDSGEDLYRAISSAASHLKLIIKEESRKFLQKRRAERNDNEAV